MIKPTRARKAIFRPAIYRVFYQSHIIPAAVQKNSKPIPCPRVEMRFGISSIVLCTCVFLGRRLETSGSARLRFNSVARLTLRVRGGSDSPLRANNSIPVNTENGSFVDLLEGIHRFSPAHHQRSTMAILLREAMLVSQPDPAVPAVSANNVVRC